MPEGLLFEAESYAIRGAIYEVYKQMSSGYLEAVYHECLALEFLRRSIPFESKPTLQLHYKGQQLASYYVPDFVCYGEIIIELKVASALGPADDAQLINYLKATGLTLGFVVNFGTYPQVQIKRLVM
jgi:GxxExxY protein